MIKAAAGFLLGFIAGAIGAIYAGENGWLADEGQSFNGYL